MGLLAPSFLYDNNMPDNIDPLHDYDYDDWMTQLDIQNQDVSSCVYHVSDLRQKFWNKHYPTWHDRCIELFGTNAPKYKDIAEWKHSWTNASNHVLVEYNRSKVFRECKYLGIHPYFWQYFEYRRESRYKDTDTGRWSDTNRPMYCVVFYYDADYYMYKLKHGCAN